MTIRCSAVATLLQSRYRHLYYWDDGTVGYAVGIEYQHSSVCTHINKQCQLSTLDCHEATDDFLCEKISTPEHTYFYHNGASGREGIEFSKPSNSSFPLTHTLCPSGHWTLDFLACDMLSACWRDDKSRLSMESDPSQLASPCRSTLSTMFMCRNGAEQVPYTLVCDHSHDCQDFSDEDFCDHPSCSGSGQFKCNNNQVRNTPTTRQMLFDP